VSEKKNEEDGSNVNKFVSFYSLVKDITKAEKPELLIDSAIWGMFQKSLKTGDDKYTLLSTVASRLGYDWPLSKSKEDVSDYIGLSFEKVKAEYGWAQKKVIFSAVAMASYSKVRSWKVLNDLYGAKKSIERSGSQRKSIYTVDASAKNKIGSSSPAHSPSVDRIEKLKAAKCAVDKALSYNDMLNRDTPWSHIKVSTWEEWRANVKSQPMPLLSIGDISLEGQFFAGRNVKNIKLSELVEFEFSFLNSFQTHSEKRAVFLSLAFLGLGNKVSTSLQPNKEKLHTSAEVVSTSSSPRTSSTMDDILGDFGL